jgi:hypothetical protein
MSKNPSTKTNTNQQFTSSYDWKSAPVNAQMQGVIDLANKPVSVDPSTQQRYGEMEEQVDRSMDDPFGPGDLAGRSRQIPTLAGVDDQARSRQSDARRLCRRRKYVVRAKERGGSFDHAAARTKRRYKYRDPKHDAESRLDELRHTGYRRRCRCFLKCLVL